jgi:hypothetical protein
MNKGRVSPGYGGKKEELTQVMAEKGRVSLGYACIKGKPRF